MEQFGVEGAGNFWAELGWYRTDCPLIPPPRLGRGVEQFRWKLLGRSLQRICGESDPPCDRIATPRLKWMMEQLWIEGAGNIGTELD